MSATRWWPARFFATRTPCAPWSRKAPRDRGTDRFGHEVFRAENSTANLESDLGREGGHSKRRILHATDLTGREIERALLIARAKGNQDIRLFEHDYAIDLITEKIRRGSPVSLHRRPRAGQGDGRRDELAAPG